MNRGRCQFCGRLKPRRADGGIAHHHVRGDRCAGVGHPPIDEADDALAAAVDRLRATARVKRAFVRDLLARRVNYVDPAHEKIADAAEREADRLARRLKRHRNWPARYRHEMMTLGYSQPPPAYLLARETD